MNLITEKVIHCRNQSPDDDHFIKEIIKLSETNGDEIYRTVIHMFTGLDLSVKEATSQWLEIVEHYKILTGMLNRSVNLITTISDYFSSSKSILKNPRLIELDTFEKVIQKSIHDGLTGVFNKTYFQNTLDQQISLAKRNNSYASILFLDIDDFKEVNDTYGHPFGDIILQRIAEILSKAARTSDVVARYGGEEFIILMPNTNHINALIMSERIRKKIESSTMALNNQSCRITVSGGVSSFPTDTRDAVELIYLADRALYRAKGAGKNNISLFREDKRRFLRIKFNRSIKVKELGFDTEPTQSGKSKDMSVGGILFQNKEPLAIGTRIQVSIPMSETDKPVLLIGTIVRVEAFNETTYDIGMILSFKEMEKTAKDEISRFLIQQSKGFAV